MSGPSGPSGASAGASNDWDDELARAQKAYDANKRLVEAGEKFRSQKPPPPRRPSRGGAHGYIRKVG